VDGQRLLLDIYRSREAEAHRPAVILIHGGGWRCGDKSDNRAFATQLAKEGIVAFSVDYRLAKPTGNKHPAQLDDA
jgi:acetyl esterase/lipase